MTNCRSRSQDDAPTDRWVRTLRAAVRCQPLMYSVVLLCGCIWWTWSDAKGSAVLASEEVQEAKRAAISAKYEAREVKQQLERTERGIDRQLQTLQKSIDRLVDHMIEGGAK